MNSPSANISLLAAATVFCILFFANNFVACTKTILNNPLSIVNDYCKVPRISQILLKSGVKLENVQNASKDLKICRNYANSCCKPTIEQALFAHAEQELKKRLQDKLINLWHTLDSISAKIDKAFPDMIHNARRELHQMFRKTYGLLYEQNVDIFSNLFNSLSAFYAKNNVNVGQIDIKKGNSSQKQQKVAEILQNGQLDSAIDRFYTQLYQRVFVLLNQPYKFDPTYLNCVGLSMQKQQLIGDISDGLKKQVNKSLIAAKIFSEALKSGRDVVRSIVETEISQDCKVSWMRMSYCSYCDTYRHSRPCMQYCTDVAKSCIAERQESVGLIWEDYCKQIVKFIDHLEGPYQMELVVQPLSVKISESIMNLQDKGQEIVSKVIELCGKHKILSKRSTNERKKLNVVQSSAKIASNGEALNFKSLLKDVRSKIEEAGKFWQNLPRLLCHNNNDSVHRRENQRCWNGSSIGEYKIDSGSQTPYIKSENQWPQLKSIITLMETFNAENILMPAPKIIQASNQDLSEFDGSGFASVSDFVETDDEDLFDQNGNTPVYDYGLSTVMIVDETTVGTTVIQPQNDTSWNESMFENIMVSSKPKLQPPVIVILENKTHSGTFTIFPSSINIWFTVYFCILYCLQ